MTRIAATTLALLAAATGVARAQLPSYGLPQQQTVPGTAGIPLPQNFKPPLSPYLNLLRGGDPAINYYYAVRPGLSLGQSPQGSLTTAPAYGFSQLRQGFLTPRGTLTTEPLQLSPTGEVVPILRSAAHPVSYGGLNRFTPSAAAATGAARRFINPTPKK